MRKLFLRSICLIWLGTSASAGATLFTVEKVVRYPPPPPFIIDENGRKLYSVRPGRRPIVVKPLITVATNTSQIWNGGGILRWSTADGLTGNLYATGTDSSGMPAGTLIGTAQPSLTQFGLTAPVGALVGEIGGVYRLLGTSFSGLSWGNGVLNLMYWDVPSAAADGGGAIVVDITGVSVPEPATWAMLIIGFGLIGATRRYHRMAAHQR
jgi:hypothetical protein